MIVSRIIDSDLKIWVLPRIVDICAEHFADTGLKVIGAEGSWFLLEPVAYKLNFELCSCSSGKLPHWAYDRYYQRAEFPYDAHWTTLFLLLTAWIYTGGTTVAVSTCQRPVQTICIAWALLHTQGDW